MFGHPARGREHVRKAYEAFKRERDFASCYRALAAILATYFFEYSTLAPMSRWLAEFHAFGIDYDALPGDDVKAVAAVGVWSALVVREPQHPELPLWESRMHAMLAFDVDPNVKVRGAMLLGKHYWYTGQYERAWPLAGKVAGELDKPELMPYSRLVWHLLLLYDAWSRGDAAAGRLAATQALELAERCGIHLIDCHLQLHAACFALALGDTGQRREAARARQRAAQPGAAARSVASVRDEGVVRRCSPATTRAPSNTHRSRSTPPSRSVRRRSAPRWSASAMRCSPAGDDARLAPQLERLARARASQAAIAGRRSTSN